MRNLIALIIIASTLLNCAGDIEISGDLINRIPTDSKIIVHTNNLEDLNQFFSGNELYTNLSGLSRFQEIQKASSFLNDYDLKDDSLIALSMEGKNEVVITLITSLIEKQADSTDLTSVIKYNNVDIIKTQKGDFSYYSINHKGVHLASSSRLVLESLVRRDVTNYMFDDGFEHIYQRTKSGNTFYVKATEKKWLEQFLLGSNISDAGNHAQWYQLEAQTGDFALQLDGVITYKDSLKMDHDLYNNIEASENHIQEVVPVTLLALKSVSYKNASQLIDNLKRYHNNDVKVGSHLMSILNNTQEMSEVALETSSALVFTLKTEEAIFMNLDSLSTSQFTYRDYEVFELIQPLKTNAIQPLVQSKEYKFVVVIDQHLVFSNTATTLEEFISNYQNKTVLAEQAWWKKTSESLSSSSSLLKISSLKKFKNGSKNASKEDIKLINKLSKNDFPLIISQYVHEDEYAHFHMIIPLASNSVKNLQVSQVGAYKSPEKIIAGPFLFPNHLSKRHDVAFQDEKFTLHLVSETGKKWWSKPLDGLILGGIESIDAYKNGRKQLVFATGSSVYFVDRNGKDVNAYPVTFKDPITQALSIFDYDSKRDYRFLVTQGKELIMLDRDGKTVRGFSYDKAAQITTQPKHFRVMNKDYIVFSKADHSIALLSRTGGVRTKVEGKPRLISDLFFHKNFAIALTKEGKLMQLDLIKGNINYTGSYRSDASLVANSNIKLIQNNNEFIINGFSVTLPYGTYLPAKLTNLSSGDYIHIIETGEHKVYVLDKNGEVLSSLPVYGKSQSAVAQSQSRYLTTLDGDDVLIYTW
jgi:hypothetical protein